MCSLSYARRLAFARNNVNTVRPYIAGVMGLIWYVFWLWLCFEKPSLHPTISAKELNYIEKSLGAAQMSPAPTIVNTPWKEFFTSMPVYAIIVANFCRSWNFYLLVLFQASYLHSFNFEVSAVSMISTRYDISNF